MMKIPSPLQRLHGFIVSLDRRFLSCANPVCSHCEGRLRRIAPILFAVILVLFPLVSLYKITWDIPHEIGIDGALYTDEGFYSGDAVTWYLEGKMYIGKEFNQFITIPFLQWVQVLAFATIGFGLLTIRLLNLLFFLGLLAAAYFLFRRFVGHRWALGGVALICLNHVMFIMARYALAEVPMAFFVTASLACTVHARGRHAYLLAACAALLFTCGVLTKTNAIVLAPLVAVMMIFAELDWRRIAVKFVLCSAVFLGIMGAYYVLMVRPLMTEFLYFFTLNVGGASPVDLPRIAQYLPDIVGRLYSHGDPVLILFLPVVAVAYLLFAGRMRGNPLFWLMVAWVGLYLYFYSYYGRIYPRFFTLAAPAFAGIVIVALKAFWEQRDRRFYLFHGLLLLVAVSTAINVWRTGGYLVNMSDSYNEMARDVRAIMDADPDSNNVMMGHNSGAMALRIGVIPRHDRYSATPIKERIEAFRPTYHITENVSRLNPLENYFMQKEWLEYYYETELVKRYNIINNYRGYPMVLYKLVPREEVWNEID